MTNDGSIDLEQAKEILAKYPLEIQVAFIYASVENLTKAFHGHPLECEKKYVKLATARLVLVGVGCFCAGSGGMTLYATLKMFGLV